MTAATAKAAKKPTAAQSAALKVIAAGGVRVRSMGVKYGTSIGGPAGAIASCTFDTLIRNKWAVRDHSSQNNWGYDVVLTDLGRSLLPSGQAGKAAPAVAKPVAEEGDFEPEPEPEAEKGLCEPVAAPRKAAEFEDFEVEVEEGDFEPESEVDLY
ncbi:hypothetical protein [Streptomyces mirabilis]|uniref:hypothetical protein n=1 Tax=Streptomyces mirabilis TaxID=68239 RepID=UPI002255708D|nr:hypothetical protein [Streptomyces mirabilis]MCX4609423.1 hypothetical protein [Streptomyces mirabilis]